MKKTPKKLTGRDEQTRNKNKQKNKTKQKLHVQEQWHFSLSLSSGVTPPASSPGVDI
jgi:hypothetical protein